ncbi:YjjI family glycine radical enzyme [Ferrimonas balearica]|uniref:YjjI family glycine radical enzyme n=1 Tax=Ferrimonas balearica TaxID=44012 RepID=UPI001C996864|nr:YjjI family glycine radical enzyme [Ferrimonas balearica]MBY5920278.1 YjjI family glycine radical enzyme [Ferrimonas balearica]MBY5997037.1 YjjI family glycine radical enzyme [Ferrimonas balearica]
MPAYQTLLDDAARLVRLHTLTPAQKQLALYQRLEAELPGCNYSDDVAEAVKSGLLHEMFEPAAPFKPRYTLPDYAKTLTGGSEFLELEPAQDLDDALHLLTILYQHVPSVTTYPVFLGHLDTLLEPFVGDLCDEQLYKKLRRFWQMIDRIVPDSFAHVNLGPQDSRVGRTLLRIDAELAQSVPNLTFRYQAGVTPDDLLALLTNNIIACNKPHIANHERIAKDFEGDYANVSCFNSLPLGGGAHTLLRLNLRVSFALCDGTVEDYLNTALPRCVDLMARGLEHRIRGLVEDTQFYRHHFLCQEGLLDPAKFTAMFGIYGTAELVNQLMAAAGKSGRYGLDEEANTLAETLIAAYAEAVDKIEMPHCLNNKVMLHAQSGISCDTDETAGTRIPIGEEPDPASYIRATARMHTYFQAGVSDILGFDPTIRRNPEAMTRLIRGGFRLGMRVFTANLSDNDLVRVTGFLVKKSDIEKYRNQAERHQSTALGLEAVDVGQILSRQARTLNHEQNPSNLW